MTDLEGIFLGRTSLHNKRFRARRRESWDESKNKRGIRGGGEGAERFPFSPPPPPSMFFFFCSRFTFRAITRLETLATQAKVGRVEIISVYSLTKLQKRGGRARASKK